MKQAARLEGARELEMKHEPTRELFAYWNRLRGERSAPERSEIDPAAIRGVLADAFMLDVDTEKTFPFRLAGTRVNGLFDAEQKGRSFLELWRGDERRDMAAVLLSVADMPAPIVAGGSAAPRGHEPCGFEFLFLPLRHFGKTHARILGLVTPALRPAWLGLLPLQPLTMTSLRVVDELVLRSNQQVARVAGVGGAPSGDLSYGSDLGLAPTPTGFGRGRPRLRIIEGGRAAV